jgi:general secretion pathway protein G
MNETRRDVSRRGGFSLIELLLVLVILAILAAVVVPKFTGRSEDARIAAAKTDVSQMETAIDMFEQDAGRFPSTSEGLTVLTRQQGLGSDVKAWKGPYLKREVPTDPWGNPYVYRQPGNVNTTGYDLFSMGKDGKEGNEDDIGNWTQAK